MVSRVSSGMRLGPNGGDAVSTGHGKPFNLTEKLINTRKKRQAQKAEQQKKKTPGDGFQPRQELEGWVRFLQKDAWWLVGQVGELKHCLLAQSSGRASSEESDDSQDDEADRGVEEMGAAKGDADDGGNLLEEAQAGEPVWGIMYHSRDVGVLSGDVACDSGYAEVVQLEECGYAVILAAGGQEWMSPSDDGGISMEELGGLLWRQRFLVERGLGVL